MTTLILRANPAKRDGGYIQIAMMIGGPAAFETRKVEIKNTADAVAALDQYCKDAEATGKGLACYMSLSRGNRSPNGFKREADKPRYVNLGDAT